jgi:6-pyruvoyltetrahydropterin/6-carboxytetrahydropterin synthase
MIFIFGAGFSAAHFYKNPKWTDEKNKEVFGKCFTQYGHGHDYQVEVAADCSEDLADQIHQIIRNECHELEHQHLNFVIEEFKSKIPTTENIAEYLSEKISASIKNKKAEARLCKLRLFESPQVWVEFIF